jgi:hypothetical protein
LPAPAGPAVAAAFAERVRKLLRTPVGRGGQTPSGRQRPAVEHKTQRAGQRAILPSTRTTNGSAVSSPPGPARSTFQAPATWFQLSPPPNSRDTPTSLLKHYGTENFHSPAVTQTPITHHMYCPSAGGISVIPPAGGGCPHSGRGTLRLWLPVPSEPIQSRSSRPAGVHPR